MRFKRIKCYWLTCKSDRSCISNTICQNNSHLSNVIDYWCSWLFNCTGDLLNFSWYLLWAVFSLGFVAFISLLPAGGINARGNQCVMCVVCSCVSLSSCVRCGSINTCRINNRKTRGILTIYCYKYCNLYTLTMLMYGG